MFQILAVARREIYSFFVSFRAYVILSLGLSLFTLFFGLMLADGREASMRQMFEVMHFLFLTICPILTMGLIAEEHRSGTIELLRTAPMSRAGVVVGKYLGAMAIFLLLVASTFHFYGILEHFGAPDRWPVATGYLGLMCEGSLLIAMGLFASSLTASQAVAGLLTYGSCFVLYALALVEPYVPGKWAGLITYFGLGNHLDSMARGLIETQDLVYFASTTLFFLGLTVWRFQTRG